MTEPDKAEMAKGPVVKAATIEIAKKYGGFPTEELPADDDAIKAAFVKHVTELARSPAASLAGKPHLERLVLHWKRLAQMHHELFERLNLALEAVPNFERI